MPTLTLPLPLRLKASPEEVAVADAGSTVMPRTGMVKFTSLRASVPFESAVISMPQGMGPSGIMPFASGGTMAFTWSDSTMVASPRYTPGSLSMSPAWWSEQLLQEVNKTGAGTKTRSKSVKNRFLFMNC
ncbi:hypothetical protein [Butyricimonas synergistica]|uniref:hypothetical protein n=1 Tax=Butyricimonas synergistica TaxID=544644 RepID=UPI0012DD0A1E|nr:hypothetical protein [Butyricimonas synergistica]